MNITHHHDFIMPILKAAILLLLCIIKLPPPYGNLMKVWPPKYAALSIPAQLLQTQGCGHLYGVNLRLQHFTATLV